MSDFLLFDGISKRFGNLTAVDNVTVGVEKGEFFSLLGPSGCGKTTLLRMLAGFEKPDTGRIFLDGKDITDLPPNKRRVNTVFQNYALFPHLNVRDNIAFGLKLAGRPKKEIEREVDAMLELIQMGDHELKRPSQISGGQKQRVAIARALVNHPQVLLLDEPLAALDLKLRQHMQIELDLIHDEVGITFLYVTHDQGEAMSLSDRIAVMNKGKIEQIDNPTKIYESPRSSFVAAFIGDTNFFDGVVDKAIDNEYSRLRFTDFEPIICFNDKKIRPGSPVHLSVRPEKIRISHECPENPDGKLNIFRATAEDVVYQGSHTRFWVRIGEYRISVFQPHSRFLLDQRPIKWGNKVWLSWHADDGYMLEQYQETDEDLLILPPENIGDMDEEIEEETTESEESESNDENNSSLEESAENVNEADK
ncbi:MAG: ABC transporter ATP-binding protein [Kiritimatiellae bacterium]|nr:ABC transporter ATP-binding protein [Kiritimatiellia bacterium]